MEEIINLINEGKLELALSKIDGEDEQSLYYKSLILFKMDKYEASLKNIEKGLEEAKKFYYDFIKLEVQIYYQTDKYKEALKILEEELSMPYTPRIYLDYFKEVYSNIMKEMRANEKTYSPFDALDEDELKKELMKKNKKNLILLINQLNKRNVRNYMDEVRKLLVSDIPSIYKSSILEILNEQGINEEIKVIKKDLELTVIPSNLTHYVKRKSTEKIARFLENLNVTNDVSISNNYSALLVQYLGDIYPLDVSEDEEIYVAIAVHYLANELFGYKIDLTNLIRKHELSKKVVDYYINEIRNVNDTFVS